MANISISNPTILNTETSDVTKLTANDNDLVNGLTDGTKDLNVNQIIVTTLVVPAIPPVGTIIDFYDYNATLTFNASYWAYCNGQTKTIAGIGSQTLPDLSNRYCVGFGTEGGSDNGSEAWATAAVGNASHQIDLSAVGASHTHTGPSHTHDVDIASFTSGAEAAHTHTGGTLQFKVGHGAATSHYFAQVNGSPGVTIEIPTNNYTITGAASSLRAEANQFVNADTYTFASATAGTSSAGSSHTHAVDPGNTTSAAAGTGASGAGSSHTHAVDPGNTTSSAAGTGVTGATAVAGSSTQTIQPRSIRVRKLMRIL